MKYLEKYFNRLNKKESIKLIKNYMVGWFD